MRDVGADAYKAQAINAEAGSSAQELILLPRHLWPQGVTPTISHISPAKQRSHFPIFLEPFT